MNYENYYIKPPQPKVPMDQLIQLVRIVDDGDLISKDDRNLLVQMGYAARSGGYNIITPKGITYLQSQDRLA